MTRVLVDSNALLDTLSDDPVWAEWLRIPSQILPTPRA